MLAALERRAVPFSYTAYDRQHEPLARQHISSLTPQVEVLPRRRFASRAAIEPELLDDGFDDGFDDGSGDGAPRSRVAAPTRLLNAYDGALVRHITGFWTRETRAAALRALLRRAREAVRAEVSATSLRRRRVWRRPHETESPREAVRAEVRATTWHRRAWRRTHEREPPRDAVRSEVNNITWRRRIW